MKDYDVIVVGAGAAGLMSAGQAASLGANTLLLEKMDQPGRKIFITGKFRCNLTNIAPVPEFIDHFNREGRFLRQAFHRFFSKELIVFFQERGVPTVTERGGRVFPASGKSADVVSALVGWCQDAGVEIRTHTPVERLLIESDRIQGVATTQGVFKALAVILACGGASYPGTGSTGDGYSLAESAGHRIVPVRPTLVPLLTAGNTAQNLQGLSLRNVNLTLLADGIKTGQHFGEMLFTHFGISGPIVLTLSREVVSLLAAGRKVSLSIDLKPALDPAKLDQRLLRDFDNHGRKKFQTYLSQLLPRKLIPTCIELTSIPAEKSCHQITSAERRRLLEWLKDFRLEVIGQRGFRHAIVTAGGVDTREIDPRSMGSRLLPGLYFAGEIIDVDADTGGFNLQAAFSTGWLAGRSAAQSGASHE
jgi:predicted Rossmann fold flavoprotein